MEGGVAERQATPGLSGEFNGAGSHFSISELARFGAANGDCGWTQEPHPPIFTWIPTELNYPERPTFSSLFGLGFDFSSVDQWVHSNLNGDPDRLGGITSQGDSGEAKVLAHNPSSGIPPSMGSAAIQGIKRKLAASLSGAADRLRLVDIRAIFEAFHANRQPPPHSEFQIVLGVDNGNNISPPSFEFEGEFRKSATRCLTNRTTHHTNFPRRWSLHLDETPAEESCPVQDPFQPVGLCHHGYSSSRLSLDCEWSAVRQANSSSETILLPQGGCRVQQSQGRYCVDHGTCCCMPGFDLSPVDSLTLVSFATVRTRRKGRPCMSTPSRLFLCQTSHHKTHKSREA
jgi:hypothetical protein